jgi:hypothetical protein
VEINKEVPAGNALFWVDEIAIGAFPPGKVYLPARRGMF